MKPPKRERAEDNCYRNHIPMFQDRLQQKGSPSWIKLRSMCPPPYVYHASDTLGWHGVRYFQVSEM